MNKAVQYFLYEACFVKCIMWFYYNFITIELGKLKVFHNFALQKEYFFSKNRWIFILKWICILRKVRVWFLLQIVIPRENINIKKYFHLQNT